MTGVFAAARDYRALQDDKFVGYAVAFDRAHYPRAVPILGVQ